MPIYDVLRLITNSGVLREGQIKQLGLALLKACDHVDQTQFGEERLLSDIEEITDPDIPPNASYEERREAVVGSVQELQDSRDDHSVLDHVVPSSWEEIDQIVNGLCQYFRENDYFNLNSNDQQAVDKILKGLGFAHGERPADYQRPRREFSYKAFYPKLDD